MLDFHRPGPRSKSNPVDRQADELKGGGKPESEYSLRSLRAKVDLHIEAEPVLFITVKDHQGLPLGRYEDSNIPQQLLLELISLFDRHAEEGCPRDADLACVLNAYEKYAAETDQARTPAFFVPERLVFSKNDKQMVTVTYPDLAAFIREGARWPTVSMYHANENAQWFMGIDVDDSSIFGPQANVVFRELRKESKELPAEELVFSRAFGGRERPAASIELMRWVRNVVDLFTDKISTRPGDILYFLSGPATFGGKNDPKVNNSPPGQIGPVDETLGEEPILDDDIEPGTLSPSGVGDLEVYVELELEVDCKGDPISDETYSEWIEEGGYPFVSLTGNVVTLLSNEESFALKIEMDFCRGGGGITYLCDRSSLLGEESFFSQLSILNPLLASSQSEDHLLAVNLIDKLFPRYTIDPGSGTDLFLEDILDDLCEENFVLNDCNVSSCSSNPRFILNLLAGTTSVRIDRNEIARSTILPTWSELEIESGPDECRIEAATLHGGKVSVSLERDHYSFSRGVKENVRAFIELIGRASDDCWPGTLLEKLESLHSEEDAAIVYTRWGDPTDAVMRALQLRTSKLAERSHVVTSGCDGKEAHEKKHRIHLAHCSACSVELRVGRGGIDEIAITVYPKNQRHRILIFQVDGVTATETAWISDLISSIVTNIDTLGDVVFKEIAHFKRSDLFVDLTRRFGDTI